MRDLTDRQRETLDHIRAYVRRHGFPPSRAELSESLGLTHPSSADVHLSALQRKGWIEIRPDTKRGIRLVGDADPAVPLIDLVEPIGEIAAGEPIVVESRIVDQIPSAVAERFSPGPDYFLRVRGDSMDRTGLRDGDLVAIRATPEANSGDVVVARFGDEVTLKRFVRVDERHVELRPDSHNPEHGPIEIDLAKHILHIDGVAVGALIGRLGETERLHSPRNSPSSCAPASIGPSGPLRSKPRSPDADMRNRSGQDVREPPVRMRSEAAQSTEGHRP